MLQYLLEEVGKPEDVHLEDDAENTPLHNAALRGNYEACQYLLSKGAKADSRNLKGDSPICIASDDKVKQLLQDSLGKSSEGEKS